MKRWIVGLTLVAATVGLTPGLGVAQVATPTSYNVSTNSSTSLYVGMPLKLARDLQIDPSLINNQGFLYRHPDLVSWMQTHPEQAQELQAEASMTDMTDANGMMYGSAVGASSVRPRFNPFLADGVFFNANTPVTGTAVPPNTPIGPNGLPIGGFAGNGQLGAIGPNGTPIGGITSGFPPGTTLGPNGLPIAPVPNQQVGSAFPAGTVLAPNGLPIAGSGVTLPTGSTTTTNNPTTTNSNLVRPPLTPTTVSQPALIDTEKPASAPTTTTSALQRYLMTHPAATQPQLRPTFHSSSNKVNTNSQHLAKPVPAHVQKAPSPPHQQPDKKKKKKKDND